MKLRAVLFFVLVAALLVPGTSLRAAPRCFPEAPAITNCVDGRLKTFWEQHGGLPVFGYPLSAAAEQPNESGRFMTQHFERTRLEVHSENQPPYDVLLGRMGVEALARQNRDWTTFPKGDAAAAHYFKETGHAIAPQFWGYWSSHGLEFDGRPGTAFAESLALFGMPLSEPQMETNPTDGKQYLTQWFERARFEHHPEHAGTPYEVLLGLLGRENGQSTSSPTTPVTPPAPQEPGGFIEVSGSQLTRLGQPVQLKGVNYYPQGRPWRDMWNAWDGPQVERELRMARDQLGINAVRVLVPYSLDPEHPDDGRVTPEMLRGLREMTQIAGSLDLRLIVTLFDFYENFPSAGSRAEQENLTYLRTIIGNFAGDDRIIAWDLHNEPDHYKAWREVGSGQVLRWLGRMADEVHQIAPNHLVTVGMGYYQNFLIAGPDGRRVIDYSDMLSVHIYNALDAARQLDELRTHTSKPLVLGEFGWPTGITCLKRDYTEAVQLQTYRDTLAAATGRVSGVFAWTLRDFDQGPSKRWDSREEYYGLYRTDNSLKPAAEELRKNPAAPLPSLIRTNLPLTAAEPNPLGGLGAPLLVPDSNHYVKHRFRRAWDLLGGRGTFGLPVSEAFVIAGDIPKHDRVIQYFEAGVLELYPEGAKDPNYHLLPEAEQIKLVVVPWNIGSTYAAGRIPTKGGQPVADVFKGYYRGVHGQWRLGEPITGAFTESINGVSTTVQYFEKGRLQVNPATQGVEMGHLGSWAWEAQCQSAP